MISIQVAYLLCSQRGINGNLTQLIIGMLKKYQVFKALLKEYFKKQIKIYVKKKLN